MEADRKTHHPEASFQNDSERLLSDDTWPTPAWHSAKEPSTRVRDYDSYLTYQLRTQYRELEGEFRSVFGNFKNTRYVDAVTAGRIVELLHSARGLLEASNPDLLAASSELALAERYMVWIYPPHILKPRGTRILSDLGSLDIREATLMREELARALKPDVQELFGEGNALGILRAVLDEALALVNHQLQQKQIGTGLQLRRLGALLKTGLVALVMFVAVSPLIINPGALLIGDRPTASVWIQGAWLVGVAVVGALGGFLSGLIQVRSSQITLGEYQESMLKLWLRPLVGALVALVVFILLSWQIVPGVKVDNPGSYILFAFLAGFSERYFLTLLRLDSTDGKQAPTRSGDPSHPQPQRLSDEKGASARGRRD